MAWAWSEVWLALWPLARAERNVAILVHNR
jgi:hypothetical protein